MPFEEFGLLLSEIVSRAPVAPGRPLLWTIVANPKAGGFAIGSRWKKNRAQLLECRQRALANPLREGGPSRTARAEGGALGELGLALTRAPGGAGEVADLLVEEARAALNAAPPGNGAGGRPFFLVIAAGGDGTSLEAQAGLYRAPPEVRENAAVVRLPMGTGNDGADAWELDEALNLLIEPADLAWRRALRLRTASGKGPFFAFNILSVGLDAFVTRMTNKMKGKFPGDSYKLWVDIAALLYDRIYKVGWMDVRSRDGEGKEARAFREKLLLLAVGESGRRTYGSHKWILPDDRNVCAVRQMPLFRKFALKGRFASGTHIAEPEAALWNASAVEFSSQYPILAQMDGETALLEEGDFPASIELAERAIQTLRKKAPSSRPFAPPVNTSL